LLFVYFVHYTFFILKGNDYLEDIGVDGTIFKWTSMKQVARVKDIM
jgi:hypothetical protein